MAIYAATDDTHVNKAANGDALATKVALVAKEVINVAGITGDHSFNLTPYTASMVAYARKWAGF